MPALIAVQLGHAFRDDVPLFEGASFTLHAGWTGVVGPNGAGKSTLLALFAGARPTSGHVRREGRDVTLCPQRVDAPVTGEVGPRLLGRLRLDPAQRTRWDTLSPGERKRWQIAAALHSDPDVLLLDEPTNHLDATARDWLASALSGFRGVGVIVSHDRALLDDLTSRTLRIADGRCVLYPGGYSDARRAWEAEIAARNAAHAARIEDERRQRARLADARRVSASVEAQRSAGRRMKDRHDSDERGLFAQFRVDRASATVSRQVEVVRADHARAKDALATSRYEGELGRSVVFVGEPAPVPWVSALSGTVRVGAAPPLELPAALQVGREDRVRIAGDNGAGKTTLLRALVAAARIPEPRVLWLPQELPSDAGRAWLDELRGPTDRATRGRVLQIVAALGVDPARLLASADPSPGEARKLGIARGLAREVWLTVLDEPTNHLDLPSIERLEAALAAWPGALVLVSHDDTFARALTTRTWTVAEGRVLG